MTYKVEFTHAALVKIAARQWNKDEIESKIRADLAETCASANEDNDDPEDQIEPGDLMFSMVSTSGKSFTDGDNDELWMAQGQGEDGVLVDSASFKAIPIKQEGNFGPGGIFEGKSMMMPVGDSDDYDPELE